MIAGSDTLNGAASSLIGQVGLFGKPRDQRAPRRIGKRGKGAIERGGTKLNHVVKYRPGRPTVKRPLLGSSMFDGWSGAVMPE